MRRKIPKFENVGLLWLRVLMGCGIAYHGYTKIFGGGMEGFSNMIGQMGFPFPVAFAWMAALAEFAGGILIVIGLATRMSALFVFITMLVAVFVAHGGDPYARKELALAYLVMTGALISTGAGKFSLDKKVFKEKA